MKVHSQAEWHLQGAAFAADPSPLAPKFKKFIETWADQAEDHLARRKGEIPIDGLRLSLASAEESAGPFSIGFIGQALLLLCTHWAAITDRDKFFDSMTPIEQHLFNDAVAVWQVHQAMQARMETDQETNHETGN